MSKLNVKQQPIYTHEGGRAKRINAEQQLRRSVMGCLLWEDQFYEDGISIAERIKSLVPQVEAKKVAEIAIEARLKMKLRHAPLLIVREMARHDTHKSLVSSTLSRIIQRVDELSEFLAIYWQEGKQPISAQAKRGLAEAFTKFDSYQLAKYNRDATVKLRDVLFLCHAKPKDEAQGEVWKQLVDGTLPIPDTWEVALSSGTDKKTSWERLLREDKLGALALLRNLRNMESVGVDSHLVKERLSTMRVERVLPFRFIAAAKYAPQWENTIEEAMMRALSSAEKLSGKTLLLIDVSGSMTENLSSKSEMTRMDAAAGLGILAREILDCRVFTFSTKLVEIPARHGFALRDAIVNSQMHSATYLGDAVRSLLGLPHDRLIVISDEQAHDDIPNPVTRSYVVNVASFENGVGYGAWTHIDGWSEAVLDYIRAFERVG